MQLWLLLLLVMVFTVYGSDGPPDRRKDLNALREDMANFGEDNMLPSGVYTLEALAEGAKDEHSKIINIIHPDDLPDLIRHVVEILDQTTYERILDNRVKDINIPNDAEIRGQIIIHGWKLLPAVRVFIDVESKDFPSNFKKLDSIPKLTAIEAWITAGTVIGLETLLELFQDEPQSVKDELTGYARNVLMTDQARFERETLMPLLEREKYFEFCQAVRELGLKLEQIVTDELKTLIKENLFEGEKLVRFATRVTDILSEIRKGEASDDAISQVFGEAKEPFATYFDQLLNELDPEKGGEDQAGGQPEVKDPPEPPQPQPPILPPPPAQNPVLPPTGIPADDQGGHEGMEVNPGNVKPEEQVDTTDEKKKDVTGEEKDTTYENKDKDERAEEKPDKSEEKVVTVEEKKDEPDEEEKPQGDAETKEEPKEEKTEEEQSPSPAAVDNNGQGEQQENGVNLDQIIETVSELPPKVEKPPVTETVQQGQEKDEENEGDTFILDSNGDGVTSNVLQGTGEVLVEQQDEQMPSGSGQDEIVEPMDVDTDDIVIASDAGTDLFGGPTHLHTDNHDAGSEDPYGTPGDAPLFDFETDRRTRKPRLEMWARGKWGRRKRKNPVRSTTGKRNRRPRTTDRPSVEDITEGVGEDNNGASVDDSQHGSDMRRAGNEGDDDGSAVRTLADEGENEEPTKPEEGPVPTELGGSQLKQPKSSPTKPPTKNPTKPSSKPSRTRAVPPSLPERPAKPARRKTRRVKALQGPSSTSATTPPQAPRWRRRRPRMSKEEIQRNRTIATITTVCTILFFPLLGYGVFRLAAYDHLFMYR